MASPWVSSSRGGRGNRQKRTDRAGQRGHGVGHAVAEHRPESRGRCSLEAPRHRQAQAPSAEHPEACAEEGNPDDNRHRRDVALHRRRDRGGEQPERREHRYEPRRHRHGRHRRAADCGGSAAFGAGHDERQVGRQHREAARVQRRDQARRKSEADQVGQVTAHAGSASRSAQLPGWTTPAATWPT